MLNGPCGGSEKERPNQPDVPCGSLAADDERLKTLGQLDRFEEPRTRIGKCAPQDRERGLTDTPSKLQKMIAVGHLVVTRRWVRPAAPTVKSSTARPRSRITLTPSTSPRQSDLGVPPCSLAACIKLKLLGRQRYCRW